MRTTAIRGTAAAVLLSATVLGLSGCVNAEHSAAQNPVVSYGAAPSTAPTQADDQHNQADVAFVGQAVALHQQVVSIAYLATAGSSNAAVQALAKKLTADEQPQVDTLSGWLTQWHQQAPSTTDPAQVPGLLAPAQVQQLSGAKGGAFDTQWAQAVKANLTNSAQDAAAELAQGSSPSAQLVAKQWQAMVQAELSALAALSPQG